MQIYQLLTKSDVELEDTFNVTALLKLLQKEHMSLHLDGIHHISRVAHSNTLSKFVRMYNLTSSHMLEGDVCENLHAEVKISLPHLVFYAGGEREAV
jgi:hypothetical protein